MTTSEVIQQFGYSRQHLAQLRNGWKESKNGKEYPPRLIKGTDWLWEGGTIIYTDSGIKKLTEQRKE